MADHLHLLTSELISIFYPNPALDLEDKHHDKSSVSWETEGLSYKLKEDTA